MATQMEYVRALPDGGWRIGSTRVSLASVVHCYWEGLSPEAIVEEFPTLTAEQVYGAIAWYLGHQAEVDEFLAKLSIRWEELRNQNHEQHKELINRLKMIKNASAQLPAS